MISLCILYSILLDVHQRIHLPNAVSRGLLVCMVDEGVLNEEFYPDGIGFIGKGYLVFGIGLVVCIGTVKLLKIFIQIFSVQLFTIHCYGEVVVSIEGDDLMD